VLNGLHNRIYVFKKVTYYHISIETIVEEKDGDGVVSTNGIKTTTFKSTLYYLLLSIRKEPRSGSDTKAISNIDNTNCCSNAVSIFYNPIYHFIL